MDQLMDGFFCMLHEHPGFGGRVSRKAHKANGDEQHIVPTALGWAEALMDLGATAEGAELMAAVMDAVTCTQSKLVLLCSPDCRKIVIKADGEVIAVAELGEDETWNEALTELLKRRGEWT